MSTWSLRGSTKKCRTTKQLRSKSNEGGWILRTRSQTTQLPEERKVLWGLLVEYSGRHRPRKKMELPEPLVMAACQLKSSSSSETIKL